MVSLVAGLLTYCLLGCVRGSCNITGQYHRDSEVYLNISDLGIAALQDNDLYTQDLLDGGCDVNHPSTVNSSGSLVTGLTPLLLAARSNSVKVIRLLVQWQGIKLNAQTSQGCTAVHTAVSREHFHIVQLLAEMGADLNVYNSNGSTPLYIAVKQGQENTVQTLVSLGANVTVGQNSTEQEWDQGTYEYGTKMVRLQNLQIPPIYTAAEAGQSKIVSILIKAGADVNYTTGILFMTTFHYGGHRCTPLHAAVMNRHTQTVKTLLEAGCAPSYPTFHKNYPLHQAARNGDNDIVNLLVAAGAELDQKSIYIGQFTPLYEAAKEGHTDIVQILHNAGANLSLANYEDSTWGLSWEVGTSLTALHIAAIHGHSDTVRALLELGATDTDGTALTAALVSVNNGSSTSNMQTIRVLADHGADLNLTTSYGKGVIFDVIGNRVENLNFVKFLLETRQIDINTTKYHDTLLTAAIGNGHVEIVKYLVSIGAPVNHRQSSGSFPVEEATNQATVDCSNTNLEMVAFLLEHGAERKYCSDYCQDYQISRAASTGCLGLLKLLIEHGSSVKNSNALFYASTIEVAKYLVEKGADINKIDDDFYFSWPLHGKATGSLDDGNTAVYTAAARGKSEIVKYLVDSGAKLDTQNDSVLLAAAELWEVDRRASIETVKTILSLGGQIQFEKKNNVSLSGHQMAKYFGNVEIVKLLLDSGAVDVNIRTDDGTTALMFVATLNSDQNLALVKCLVAAGADANAVDNNGETVIHKMMKNKYKQASPGGDGFSEILSHLVKVGGASLNIPDNYGTFPIQLGTYIDQLVRLGAWVNVTTEDEDNLLHLGIEPIATLVENGMDLNARNKKGESPLFKAENLDRIKSLVMAGADVNIANNEEMTFVFQVVNQLTSERWAWDYWERSGRKVVKYLVRAGAALVLNTSLGPRFLTYELGATEWPWSVRRASSYSMLDLFQFLVAEGGHMDAIGPCGMTAFHKALLEKDTEKARVLLDAGADINAEAADGKTALIIATSRQDREMVTFLIEEGADVNITDVDSKSAINYSLDIYTSIDPGTEITSTSWIQYTQQKLPDFMNLLRIVQLLIDGGADVSDVEHTGKPVLALAILEDNEAAALQYFRIVSEDYGGDEEVKHIIQKNIRKYCSFDEYEKLC